MGRKRYQDMIRAVTDEVREIFPWDLIGEIERGADPLLLDIRCPREYDGAHVEGSVNVPRGILEVACDYGYEETVPELVEARDREVVVICRSGNRSILATHTLHQMGYRNVLSLKTGLRGWSDYEQPLRDGSGRTLTLHQADDYFLPKVSPEQLGPDRRVAVGAREG
jgi:rhodanese-related sulfurtransferase